MKSNALSQRLRNRTKDLQTILTRIIARAVKLRENPLRTRADGEGKSGLNLNSGEVVEVRGEKEILATLDENGALEGLLFTAEMRKYCGRRFRVLRRVTKIVVEGVGARRIRKTAILTGVTCDGEANEGCRSTCHLLWKEAWLKRLNNNGQNGTVNSIPSATENKLDFEVKSVCQSVNLLRATSPIRKWDFRQYIWDIASGTYESTELIHSILDPLSLRTQRLLVGERPPLLGGRLKRTPSATLNLQPGELVEAKSKQEILATLDFMGRNRGLHFTPEMVKYCGKRFRVLKQLDKMVNEKTGELRKISNTVLLEGSTCDGKAHGGCQRLCYCLWREIWLRRVNN